MDWARGMLVLRSIQQHWGVTAEEKDSEREHIPFG